MWSINDALLQVIQGGDFNICFKPKIAQNGRDFPTSIVTLADTRVLFLYPT